MRLGEGVGSAPRAPPLRQLRGPAPRSGIAGLPCARLAWRAVGEDARIGTEAASAQGTRNRQGRRRFSSNATETAAAEGYRPPGVSGSLAVAASEPGFGKPAPGREGGAAEGGDWCRRRGGDWCRRRGGMGTLPRTPWPH
ncbi:unnamed protein product [Rangifer tarandus platyrhynchus]|uniref:Uncharacterized protein n=2 Tax=Rangifer tarandus platyrhynchus TaxID=3082113 RepID=A0ACB0EMF0_RANTA|nr:unnamed protein product [Rangifer tarandus platyrhynchus]CAI9701786.1 unnamed protein product [Rangifer tarandus platyrhynchus]